MAHIQQLDVATSTTSIETCSIFRLPPELRLLIYEYVLADFNIDDPLSENDKNRATSLLHINKLVHNETIDLYIPLLRAIEQNARDKRDVELGQFKRFFAPLDRVMFDLRFSADRIRRAIDYGFNRRDKALKEYGRVANWAGGEVNAMTRWRELQQHSTDVQSEDKDIVQVS